MADTPNHEYNVPDQGDEDWHNPLNENFEDFEVDIELRDQEANLGDYQPTQDAKFLAIDTGVVYTGDGTNWVAQFVHPAYDASTDEAEFGSTVAAPAIDTGTLTGSVTGGQSLSTLAGNNLSISNGQLNASGGGGGGGGIGSLSGGDGIDPSSIGDGDTLSVAWEDANDLDSDGNITGGGGSGNWTVNNNLLEPSDSNIDGIDVAEVNASLLAAESGPVTVTVNGARALELTAESGDDAGNVVVGHSENSVDSGVVGATIAGGGSAPGGLGIGPNRVQADYGTVAGGVNGIAGGQHATVGGGLFNIADGQHATISGGLNNVASGERATVGGGRTNDALAQYATISGGGPSDPDDISTTKNVVYDDYGTIGGGGYNRAGSDDDNATSATYATVGGGFKNTAAGFRGTVSGGSDNTAGETGSTIGGGQGNTASGFNATVSGGINNTVEGARATIPGGSDNTASGDDSFAAGGQAKANHSGAFVWADSTNADFLSTGADQFLVRAGGGVGIGTNAPETQLHVKDSISSNADTENHVAAIENTSSDGSADVLSLKINEPGADITGGNNFITFKDDSDDGVGAIEGTGSGVTIKSGSGDFAESLPRLDAEESIESADIVGLVDGSVTRQTADADQTLVVSDQPIVTANTPSGGPADREAHEVCAFVGQVPVKVRGGVDTGDLIVPSGKEDGTGRAVAPTAYRPDDGPIVGRAWEETTNEGVTKVTVAVGIETGDALAATVEEQADRIDELEAENERKDDRIDDLEARLSALEAQVGANPAPADD